MGCNLRELAQICSSHVLNPKLIWFEEIEKKRNRDITSGC